MSCVAIFAYTLIYANDNECDNPDNGDNKNNN